jgi:NADH:ubiquinone oxidoreductase subunit K
MANDGQAMALFIIVVAAAEVSVGLALIVCVHRRTGSVDTTMEEPAAPENPPA